MERKAFEKKRGIVTRKRIPVIFLSLEGKNKTETLYFAALHKESKYSVRFVPGKKTDVEGMFTDLEKFKRSEQFNYKDGDRAFCLCDADFEADKHRKIVETINANGKSNSVIIVSNPCFEVWYLNHFRYSTKCFCSNDEVIQDLERYINLYDKNRDYYSSHLEANTEIAIKNTRKALQHYESLGENIDEITSGSCTQVVSLVEIMLSKDKQLET